MAYAHGKSSVFKIDDSGGTLRDISDYLDTVDFPYGAEPADVTGMGGTAVKSYVMGLADGTFSIGGSWNDAATTGVDTVLGPIAMSYNGCTSAGGSLSYEYGPEGDGNGDVKYSGECYLTGYTVNSPVAGRVSFSATFQLTGAVTRGTFTA